MPPNPNLTRLKSELDSAYVTIERQRRSIAAYREKWRRAEARLARFTKKNSRRKSKHG